MDNKMMKYEGNFFVRMFSKIKRLFSKNKVQNSEILKEIEDVKEEILAEEKNEEVKEDITKFEAKQKFVELVKKFDAREIEEKDLTAEETIQLTKYYLDKKKRLNKEIEMKNQKLENLKLKLNRYYEKAMKLKTE